jgi:predicted lipoprotein with Yx(FWY)xxD motif
MTRESKTREGKTREGNAMTGTARTGPGQAAPPAPSWRMAVPGVLGAGLLIATGAIHLDLYLTGYRTIPTIGWLFLLQIIAAFGFGVAVVALPLWGRAAAERPVRLVAAAAAGFSLSTLGGYILSVWIGLFGFKEVRTTAGILAGVIEVAAFAALAARALAPAPADGPSAKSTAKVPALVPAAMVKPAGLATAGLAAVALVLLGISAAGAASGGGAPVSAQGALRAATIHGTAVLTNAKGDTLYWFAPDTATTSKCYGTCAAYWPPVTGTAKAAPGVTGTLGTIKRSDGSSQITYDGHPLYTYIADSAPGQANGNNINLNGGLWHEVTISCAVAG